MNGKWKDNKNGEYILLLITVYYFNRFMIRLWMYCISNISHVALNNIQKEKKIFQFFV